MFGMSKQNQVIERFWSTNGPNDCPQNKAPHISSHSALELALALLQPVHVEAREAVAPVEQGLLTVEFLLMAMSDLLHPYPVVVMVVEEEEVVEGAAAAAAEVVEAAAEGAAAEEDVVVAVVAVFSSP
ncbi:hypothetical protein CFO_g330 [Ceratocystis platani]|uniref:Uncharacterized protein n=1 Tax=Ceratocystis fimbriata f. sp. platani TaxID=88771 RepID=A0A0F8D3M0_CERFI|nr:hypothetical protein CFO_g330 [Ceratocystis platani]